MKTAKKIVNPYKYMCRKVIVDYVYELTSQPSRVNKYLDWQQTEMGEMILGLAQLPPLTESEIKNFLCKKRKEISQLLLSA